MDIVVYDIEASCDNKELNRYYNMETIEIGAIKLRNGEIIDKFQSFIKPQHVTELTEFCTELTGIIYDDLKDARLFNEVILEFYDFIKNCETYSCGQFDRKFLVRELFSKNMGQTHNHIVKEIQDKHIDLKGHFARVTNKKKQGMIGMAQELNIELTGNHHRALDDTENLVKIFLEVEKIRERQILKIFNKETMSKIKEALNTHHEISDFGNLSTMEILDKHMNTILTDIEDDKLTYVTPRKLKTLNHYKKRFSFDGVLGDEY